MAPQTGTGADQSPLPTFLMMGAIILVFWLFMIRPQAKKAKDQKKYIENMQKGDKIVTIAGIHGKINKVNEDGTIDLETSPGSYIKIEKSAISLEWSQNANKAAGSVEKK
ncbi:preprotein translocase subunit YajC [Panacibacter ginsenosidivorans]|uniref:Sec translocon accessory complex subunit YajC n=2 Tax=Panacibacter ginsenosidivorans TaxID=1813871 RepID=A0A5B8VGV7_9BACT|nr:preprotein translocase subunit YajC [Panacibacter ginsenosidivorans]